MYHRFENLRDDQLKLRAFVQDLNKEEVSNYENYILNNDNDIRI